MDRIIAFCGLTCNDCPAYTATKADDRAALERLLAEWRVQFNKPDMDLSAVTCDGCIGEGRHGGYCVACPVRACGVARGVENCAHCLDYQGCGTLDAFLANIPSARATLEQIRLSL